jgi:hypothetical protein
MNKPAMVAKYAKGGSVKKGEQKIGRVMEEFTKGKLHSGSKEGPKVKTTKQAVAIALNEARAAGAKIPRVKKNNGGSVESDDVIMARMTKDELAQGARGVRMARERLEKQTVKKGVPPANRAPLISDRMKDVGKSIGVRKASGGGVSVQPTGASGVGKSVNPEATGLGKVAGNKVSGGMIGSAVNKAGGIGSAVSKGSVGNAVSKGSAGVGSVVNKGGIGSAVKKAAGGLTLSNAPKTASTGIGSAVNKGSIGSAVGNKVSGGMLGSAISKGSTGIGSAVNKGGVGPAVSKPAAPSKGLTLSGPNVGRRLTLGMNKGGLSVMPKGKGC